MTQIISGDCRDVLKTLPDESVHCCVTSPPYWGLRDYGHPGQIGLEPTPEAYVAELVAVFREVRRALRSDGVCWVNLGDSYATGTKAPRNPTSIKGPEVPASWSNRSQPERCGTPEGLKTKDLVGIPWRVAFALQADGWYLRQDIIWAKPNPMPESVTDRCTKAHEYVFLLAKSERYWYDAEAIREPWTCNRDDMRTKGVRTGTAYLGSGISNHDKNGEKGDGKRIEGDVPTGRNRRSVWTVATQPYSGAHFATFPPALIEPMILASCPAQTCPTCEKGWERVVERTKTFESGSGRSGNAITGKQNLSASETNSTPDIRKGPCIQSRTLGHRPSCTCPPADPVPGVTLDPFGGSGTTGQVANRLGRKAILIELNPEYRALSDRRTAQAGLMLEATA